MQACARFMQMIKNRRVYENDCRSLIRPRHRILGINSAYLVEDGTNKPHNLNAFNVVAYHSDLLRYVSCSQY